MVLYPLPCVEERKRSGRFSSGSVSVVADGSPDAGGIIRGSVTVDKECCGPGDISALFSATTVPPQTSSSCRRQGREQSFRPDISNAWWRLSLIVPRCGAETRVPALLLIGVISFEKALFRVTSSEKKSHSKNRLPTFSHQWRNIVAASRSAAPPGLIPSEENRSSRARTLLRPSAVKTLPCSSTSRTTRLYSSIQKRNPFRCMTLLSSPTSMR